MTCKKIWFPSQGKVEFIDTVYTEKINSPTEAICKNLYSQVSAGTELACLTGLEDWFTLPNCPGYTAIGQVIEKGAEVNAEVGDIILAFAPHAQYFKIDTSSRWIGVCVKLPSGLASDIASFAHIADIAITSIRKSAIELGDWVAVTGMGPVGNLAAQLAKNQGARVIGIDINEKRLDIARQCGIGYTFNSNDPEIEKKIKDLSGGKGVSTLIEASGMASVAAAAINYISFYGELILLGSPRAPFQHNLTEFLQKIHLWNLGSITVKGAHEYTIPTHEIEFTKHNKERDIAIILQLLNEGKLNIAPLYTHKVSPEDAPSVYKGLQENKDGFIGVVFDWTKIS